MHISTARDMTFPQEYLVLLNVCPRVHTFVHLCTSSALQQDLSFAIQKRHHTINTLKNKHALCVCIVICDSYYHFFFFLSNQRHPYSTIQLYLNRHCIILHTSHLLFSCFLCILSPFVLLLFHSCPSPSRPLFSPLLFQTVFSFLLYKIFIYVASYHPQIPLLISLFYLTVQFNKPYWQDKIVPEALVYTRTPHQPIVDKHGYFELSHGARISCWCQHFFPTFSHYSPSGTCELLSLLGHALVGFSAYIIMDQTPQQYTHTHTQAHTPCSQRRHFVYSFCVFSFSNILNSCFQICRCN